MQSNAATVEDYLASLPPERREPISTIRDVVNEHLPEGYVEQMEWGMVTWVVPLADYPDTYNGKPLSYISLASQKNHMAVYLMGLYTRRARGVVVPAAVRRPRVEAGHGQVVRAVQAPRGGPARRARRGGREDPGRRVHRPLRGIPAAAPERGVVHGGGLEPPRTAAHDGGAPFRRGEAHGTADVLRSSVLHTHDNLVARLETASAMVVTPGRPARPTRDRHLPRGREPAPQRGRRILLPTARKRLPDGAHVVHDYLHAARELEVAADPRQGARLRIDLRGRSPLAGGVGRRRRRAGGAPAQRDRRSSTSWRAVLDPGALADLAERLHRAESAAPTRPHPYTPHTGLPGPGRAPDPARRRLVLGHRRGSDGADAGRARSGSAPASSPSTSSRDPRFDEAEAPGDRAPLT